MCKLLETADISEECLRKSAGIDMKVENIKEMLVKSEGTFENPG